MSENHPSCFGDADTFDENKVRCRLVCPSRVKCKNEIIRQEGQQPLQTTTGTAYRTSQQTASSNITHVAPTRVVQNNTQLPPGKSLVTYKQLVDQPFKEGMIRGACAAVASAFEELGYFARYDGYRVFEGPVTTQTVLLRCPSCKETSPDGSRFCKGCGTAFQG